ncbi:MAG TPA: SIMPL domain-containing protein, partial [Pseudacidobacterium sp.]|nr:SIMPL domain-containing protein [Pseudacidobacterium sp.]
QEAVPAQPVVDSEDEADDAAKVLHVAVEAGANQSGQIDWQYRDMNGLQAKAAANTLVKAQAIAQQMAQGLNVKLAGLIFASNQAPESPQPVVRLQQFASFKMKQPSWDPLRWPSTRGKLRHPPLSMLSSRLSDPATFAVATHQTGVTA